MAARRNATPGSTSTQAGILQPEELARDCSLERTGCDEALTPWVENHWTLAWDLPAGDTFLSQTLPHPACTLSVELGQPRAGLGDDRVVLTGVETRRFDVELSGSGWVHATKFRPGGLAALTGLDASVLTNETKPAIEFIPRSLVQALCTLEAGTPATVAGARSDSALMLLVDQSVGASDEGYATVLRLVQDMLNERTLLRVAQLQDLARYRIHDIVTTLHQGYAGSMADLAARHGFYDQGHFTHEFTALVGVPPSVYRNRHHSISAPQTN